MIQPGVQLVVAFDPKPRREEPFPNQTDLVLDLALLRKRPVSAALLLPLRMPTLPSIRSA